MSFLLYTSVELISAIYKAGCTRSVVMLPIEKEDDYYTFQGILKLSLIHI